MLANLSRMMLGNALALIVVSCASAPAETARDVRVVGPFAHPSGLVFPVSIGAFVRTSVVQFPGTPDNFGISYTLGPLRSTTLTAYVYPAGSAPLEEHFEAVTADVAKHHGVRPYRLTKVTVQQGSMILEGRVASFDFEDYYQGGPKIPLRSHAYVFVRGPWVIKYRATNPAAIDDELQARVRGFIEALPPAPPQ